jgi:hypothetical protein
VLFCYDLYWFVLKSYELWMCDVWLSDRIRFFYRYSSSFGVRNIKLVCFAGVKTRAPLALMPYSERMMPGLLAPLQSHPRDPFVGA